MSEPVSPHQLPQTTEALQEPTLVNTEPEQTPQEPTGELETTGGQEMVVPPAAIELYESLKPKISPEEPAPERLRDEKGQYITKEPAAAGSPAAPQEPTTEQPSTPAMDPAIVYAAKEVGFSDDEIKAFPSDVTLRYAVAGKQAEMYQKYGPQQPQSTQPVQPEVQPQTTDQTRQRDQTQQVINELQLKLDEDASSEDLVQPIKEMVNHINLSKAAQDNEIKQLREQVAAMEGVLQQSAQNAQMDAKANQGQKVWDDVAAQVPGMLESMGKMSDATINPNSIQGVRWNMFAAPMTDRLLQAARTLGIDDINNVPMQVKVSLAKEVYLQTGFNGLVNPVPPAGVNPQVGNTNISAVPMPGQVVPSSGRNGNPNAVSATGDPEYDRVLSNMEQAWANNGGRNPFGAY